MKSKITFSRFDKIIKPMLIMQWEIGIQRIILATYNSVSKLLKDISTFQKHFILRLIFKIAFTIMGVIISLPLITIYLVIYFLLSVVTVIITTLIVIVLSLIYGVVPIIIQYQDIKKDQINTLPKYKGYHKLIYPILWSVGLWKDNSNKFYNLAMRPLYKIKTLNHDYQYTHIIERIYLTIALLYSTIIYFLMALLCTQIIYSIILISLGMILGTTWLSINVFVNVLKNENLDNDDKNMINVNEEKTIILEEEK